MGKVTAIIGGFSQDRVTQAELEALGDDQSAAWAAERKAQRKAAAIDARIAAGAEIEPGPWEFDRDRGMARGPRKSPGSAGEPPEREGTGT